MRNGIPAFVAALSFSCGVNADRECGSNANISLTYPWSVGAARYDGAEPGQKDGFATVAVSIVPGTRATGTFFECVAEWPESWAGWYEDGNIVWSDCIWAGNGPTYDTAVSFAMDWKNRTMYMSHTFACSDKEGSDSLATGSVNLDLNCTTTAEGSDSCMLTSDGLSIVTTGGPTHLVADSCTDNSESYQSWQVEDWQRQYEMVPGSSTPDSDTGPSFTLRNMANTDVFSCSPSRSQNGTFEGVCESATAGSLTSTAIFHFDSRISVLIITQSWNCSDLFSFQAVGVGYVQAGCSREKDVLTCTSDPFWIGTKIM
ncbi:hypothetical protein GGR54DRAFT_652070 [Hypoxylon sp. NC1633]|nr:hypothetical protein GGR54DRAFT_652070 [Hypoxylon sp. NC1633]